MESLFGFLMAGMAVTISISVIATVLLIWANWKIFEKAGEAGWKSLIPFYNGYVLFKITWNTTMFWVYMGLTVVVAICNAAAQGNGSGILSLLSGVGGIALFVIYILQLNKLAKAFGHNIGYTIGLIFVPNIITLILGLGDDKYLGPQ